MGKLIPDYYLFHFLDLASAIKPPLKKFTPVFSKIPERFFFLKPAQKHMPFQVVHLLDKPQLQKKVQLKVHVPFPLVR